MNRNLAVATLCLVANFCLPAGAFAQQQLTFRLDRQIPGVPVPHYSIALHDDGAASYHAEMAVAGSAELQMLDKPLTFAPATVRRAFEAAAEMKSSSTPCASKLKNIADTGLKTVVYKTQQGETTCTFNYSENKGAVHLADLFQAIELTLESGRILEFKRRFDRLGLDAEMANLASSASEGRAQGIEAIEPTLRAIAVDTELIERVRLHAGKLLDHIQKPQ